jgi:hypothetical protein
VGRTNPKRTPAPAHGVRLIPGTPVVIMRGPRVPGVFNYTDDEWDQVVAAIRRRNSNSDTNQLLIDLEAAGQRYRIGRRDLRSRRTLELDALRAWSHATGDTALKFSRVWTGPAGPLIRFLNAALYPILGAGMAGDETLVKAILRARR